MSNLIEKTINTKQIFQGSIISVQVDEVELPNGQTSKREIVKHPGAVAILPFTAEGKLILVRQFRKALEKEIYEIPAGKLEENELPEVCAKRELEEETGYTCSQLTLLTSFYTSPGFANEYIYLYEASKLSTGHRQLDQDEFMEVVEVSLEEAERLVAEQKIDDAKTMYAVLYWKFRHLQQALEQK